MTPSDVFNHTKIPILDHGYIQFIESWGTGLMGVKHPEVLNDYEVGIIEAARMSTQQGFKGWGPVPCPECSIAPMERGTGQVLSPEGMVYFQCKKCKGTGGVVGDEGLLSYLYRFQHGTPFEMAGMTIEVQAPIMVFREWHRHRTQSYNEMSARYEPLPDVNYRPESSRCLMVNAANKQAGAVKGADELTHDAVLDWLGDLDQCYIHTEQVYQKGLKIGIPKELARLPLPVGRYSRMRASTDLRNWLQFMTLRSTLKGPNAQWEIRQFADVVGQIIEQVFPKTWSLFAQP